MDRTAKQERINKLKLECEDLLRHNFQPVLVKPRSKEPLYTGWLENFMELDELTTAIELQQDVNVGVATGFPSNQLIDVDIDEPDAIEIFHKLMPSTSSVFGRFSKPASHLFYRIPHDESCNSIQYLHPETGKVLAELRGDRRMTNVPPSYHPGGEQIEYVPGLNGEPLQTSYATLRWKSALACCAHLLRKYWFKGSRHNKAIAVAGFFAANNVEEAECEKLILSVVETAEDEEPQDRLTAIMTSYQRHREGKSIDGMGALVELIGASTVQRMIEWLFGKPKKSPKRERDQFHTKQEVAGTDLDFARDFAVFVNGDMIYCDTNDTFYKRGPGVYSPINKSMAQLPVYRFLDRRLEAASVITHALARSGFR